METADPDKVKEEAGVEYGTDYNGNAIESVPFDAQKQADILSIIPGAGDVIDGMMAGQALVEGRYADVACYSFAAAFPVISGAAAKKGVQFADDLIRKLLKTGDVTAVGDVVRAAGNGTTVLGENMMDRVIPFANKTGARTLPFGTTAEEWAKLTPKQRWKLNDGALRARIGEGDSFRYIGIDKFRDPAARLKFDLTGSELLRLKTRGIPYEAVSPSEVLTTIGRP